MRKVSAVRKVHAKNGVARLKKSQIGSHVGLRAGMGLHIDVLGVKKQLGPFLSKSFDHIHIFATAVIAFARITFSILVGEYATLRLTYCSGNNILGSDKLKLTHLPL